MSVYTSKCCPYYLLIPIALNVTATAVCDVPQDNPTGSVTITLSKDLAISKDITISVSLHDPQGKLGK